MSLKDLTYEQHRLAETQPFVKVLFSGSIDPKLYATYLYNQHFMYDILEVCAMSHGLLNDVADIRRAPHIHRDFMELWGNDTSAPKICPSVQEYLDHIMSIKEKPEMLMAHIYVRHFGDLSGGQMIAKRVPGEGNYYKFNGDPTEIKNKMRAKLDDSMADEAKVCFNFATKFFQEMMDIAKNDFGIQQ